MKKSLWSERIKRPPKKRLQSKPIFGNRTTRFLVIPKHLIPGLFRWLFSITVVPWPDFGKADKPAST
jgi:hypothetical protein